MMNEILRGCARGLFGALKQAYQHCHVEFTQIGILWPLTSTLL
jgi:hypothetical protein